MESGKPKGKILVCTNPECNNKTEFIVPLVQYFSINEKGEHVQEMYTAELEDADWDEAECAVCAHPAKWVDKVEAFAKGRYKGED